MLRPAAHAKHFMLVASLLLLFVFLGQATATPSSHTSSLRAHTGFLTDEASTLPHQPDTSWPVAGNVIENDNDTQSKSVPVQFNCYPLFENPATYRFRATLTPPDDSDHTFCSAAIYMLTSRFRL